MTDVLDHDAAFALSRVTRLADAAEQRVRACGCSSAAVTVLRGFDASSRRRAAELRDRLRDRGILTTVVAAPMVHAHDHPDTTTSLLQTRVSGHPCALVDATVGGRLEVDRIGGWAGIPVVALATHPQQPPTTEVRPVVRVESPSAEPWSTASPFPSVSGRVVGIALDEVLVEPNQPGTGSLRLRLADDPPQQLPTGTTVRARVLDSLLQLKADARGHADRIWLAPAVTVEQVSGLHTVRRDGLLVADIATTLTLEAQPRGLVTDYA